MRKTFESTILGLKVREEMTDKENTFSYSIIKTQKGDKERNWQTNRTEKKKITQE